MKLFRIFDKLAMIIPQEICKNLGLREGMNMEVSEAEGIITLRKKKQTPKFSDDERKLIKKLISIKFSERTPTNVNRKLSGEEKKLLTKIVRKGYIGVYKSGKYPHGVYNVPPSTYSTVIESKSEGESKSGNVFQQQEKTETVETDPIKKLYKNGFVILKSVEEAKELSDKLSSKIRKREIRGIRGFDRNYYILKTSFISKYEGKVRNALKSGSDTVEKISSQVNIDKNACIALLTVMNEDGEIIEKRKGKFAIV